MLASWIALINPHYAAWGLGRTGFKSQQGPFAITKTTEAYTEVVKTV